MEDRLTVLVLAYILAVSCAVQRIERSGIKLPSSNLEWALTPLPDNGFLSGGIPYIKHGYGCAVTFPDGTVDFDFGEHGETNGFDLYRLINFAADHLYDYDFSNEEDVRASLEAAEKAGNILYSGYILYYLPYSISAQECYEQLNLMRQD